MNNLEIFNSFGLQHIHRKFMSTDESLLAYFTVMEILHNFNQFIEWVNNKECWDAGTWMKKRIAWLKEGHCEVYPNAWTYIKKKRHFFTKKQCKEFEKRAANEALQMLKEPHGLLKFIEDSINDGIKK